jgi:hypothetical protein
MGFLIFIHRLESAQHCGYGSYFNKKLHRFSNNCYPIFMGYRAKGKRVKLLPIGNILHFEVKPCLICHQPAAMKQKEWLYMVFSPAVGLLCCAWHMEQFEMPFRVGGTVVLFWTAIAGAHICACFLRCRPIAVFSTLAGTWLVLWPVAFPALAWTVSSICGFEPVRSNVGALM